MWGRPPSAVRRARLDIAAGYHRRLRYIQTVLNWVVIGIGDIAIRRVIPAIQAEPRSRLYGLVTRDPAKATPYARECSQRSTKPWPILRSHAVYVGTPVFLHGPQTIQSLRAGRHVLCEKPMAMNKAEARAMLQAAEESGKDVRRRILSSLLSEGAARETILASGAIGKPVVAEFTNHMWFDGTGSRSWLFDPVESPAAARCLISRPTASTF